MAMTETIVSNPKQVDVLAFGPHPDDIELGCAGTLCKLAQSGFTFGMVDLTEGEKGSRGTVAERQAEAREAAKILGAGFRENLQIADASIDLSETNRLKIMELIRRYQPTLIFVPYHEDRHPDHFHASRLLTEAAFYSGVNKIGSGPAHRPRRVIYYMITNDFPPSFVVDISEQFDTKMRAIQAHQSQFYNPDYPGKETFIASRDYLESIETRARYFGWKAGVRYAEPFWVREPIVIEDLFSALGRNKM